MTEETPTSKNSVSADWLFRGVLTKLGDTFDRFTGRRWIPSSSLATSELIERLKTLLDAEAKQIAGKGSVVPHNICLKMQWDKFSDNAETGIAAIRSELLTAAADHINDSLYYTLAPLTLDVRTDYFTEGVKLSVSFDKFNGDGHGIETNVTMPTLNIGLTGDAQPNVIASPAEVVIARYALNSVPFETRLNLLPKGRISVGRNAENMLVLDDPSVSKMHASVLAGVNGGLAVADTGSTNGTFINDQRIAYGRSLPFGPGDKVKFGSVEVSFDRVPSAPENEQMCDAEPIENTMQIGGFDFKSKTHIDLEPERQHTPNFSSPGMSAVMPVAIDSADIETKENPTPPEPENDSRT